MPIYEYRCSACGHELESLQKFTDAPLVDCPSCGKPNAVKLLSAAGFQLKGSGWYATDFKGGGRSRPTKPGRRAKPEATPRRAESKTEPKTEAKAETKSEGASAATDARLRAPERPLPSA